MYLHVSSLVAQGKIQQALDAARAALASDGENPALLILAGLSASRLGDDATAEQYFRRAIAADTGYAAAYASLALILERKRCLDEAEHCHRKAASLDAGSIEFRFNLARFLAASDRGEDLEEAKAIFLELLQIAPTDIRLWNDFGILLFATGYASAAHTAFSAAVSYHPREATAHVNLGNVLLHMDDLPAAEKHFAIALNIDPELPVAHQGMASIHQRQGNEEQARHHQNLGFGTQPVSNLAYRGRGRPIQLLILQSALEGNIPWRLLIDSSVFEATIIAVEYFDSQSGLPAHDLIFNAIGDADLCRNGLEIANRLIARTTAPVINRPEAVLQTGRLRNAERLANLPGVISPRMALIAKQDFRSGAAPEMLAKKGITFPMLLRPPGFHGGNYFVWVDNPEGVNPAIEDLPGDGLLAIEFLDARSADSLYRKYRVMVINGSFYPMHLAISKKWKVHYFSSDMAVNPDYRNEEQSFLNDFAAYLGQAAISALEKIHHAIDLDYYGIDFGIGRNGDILLYEANSTMVINPPGREDLWNYKRTAVESALAATKTMLLVRATS